MHLDINISLGYLTAFKHFEIVNNNECLMSKLFWGISSKNFSNAVLVGIMIMGTTMEWKILKNKTEKIGSEDNVRLTRYCLKSNLFCCKMGIRYQRTYRNHFDTVGRHKSLFNLKVWFNCKYSCWSAYSHYSVMLWCLLTPT